MVWLRLATSAVVLVAVARPALRGRSRDDWLTWSPSASALGAMNWAIYQSFARIPLGLAVTIEFVGPLTLAVVGSRRARDLLWVGLAGARGRRCSASSRPTSTRPASPSRCSPARAGRRTSC